MGGTDPKNSELKLLRDELTDREAKKPGLLIVFEPEQPEGEPLARDEERQPPR